MSEKSFILFILSINVEISWVVYESARKRKPVFISPPPIPVSYTLLVAARRAMFIGVHSWFNCWM